METDNTTQHNTTSTLHLNKMVKRRRFNPEAVYVYIPINTTADIGVALSHHRKKLAKLNNSNVKTFVNAACTAVAANTNTNTTTTSSTVDATAAASATCTDHVPDKDITNGDTATSTTTTTTSMEIDDSNSITISKGADEQQQQQQQQNTNNTACSVDAAKKKKDDTNNNNHSKIDRSQYNSMLDYLEAKYVRGVMVEDDAVVPEEGEDNTDTYNSSQVIVTNNGEENMNSNDAEQDDDRSCYSDESGADNFLDDSALRASVYQQVVASKTMTKMEAVAAEKRAAKKAVDGSSIDNDNDDDEIDDDGFFVNVGTLEMEEGTETWFGNAEDDYEEDRQNRLKQKSKKTKTKKTAASSSASVGTAVSKSTTTGKAKAKASTTTTKVVVSEVKPAILSEEAKALKKRSEDCRADVIHLHELVEAAIRAIPESNLPRKMKAGAMAKVSVMIPEDKKPGDSIMFDNPRHAGQMFKVVVPADGKPGGTFVVNVPKSETDGSAADDDEDGDGNSSSPRPNQLTKEVRDALDIYSKGFDEWIVAESNYRHAVPGLASIKPNLERMKKYEDTIKFFPSDLVTPIDAKLLREKVKQNRQNRQKRNKWLIANGRESEVDIPDKEDLMVTLAGGAAKSKDRGDAVNATENNVNAPSKTIELKLPKKSIQFKRKVEFNKDDFVRES